MTEELETGGSVVGKIKVITCRNFVTYNECVIYPTEYLNIVIGPNGTGKSTLVAAVVLGMGGTPKLLARSSALQNYIKNGATEATVSVEIYINERKETMRFERTFDARGSSLYKINGSLVANKTYLERISKFNIQVGNLCQFLPQDRVQDFAKMNPQELFVNTLMSVFEQKELDTFSDLKKLQHEQKISSKSLADDQNRLNDLNTQNQGLKRVMERISAKEKFDRTLKACNAKKLWLESKDLQEAARQIKLRFDEAEALLQEKQMNYDRLKEAQRNVIEENQKLTSKLRLADTKTNESRNSFDRVIGQVEELETKIRRAAQELETSKRDHTEQTAQLITASEVLRTCVENLKQETGSSAADEERKSKIEVLRGNLDRIKVEIAAQLAKRTEINNKLDEEYVAELQNLRQRIQSLESFKEQRLKLIEAKFPDQYKAIMWLRSNLEHFEGRIYEPMIMELNIKDPNNAKYFEYTIPLRDLLAFTCENKADMSKLIDFLSIQQHLPVSIVHSPPASTCNYSSPEAISEYEGFGFQAYLIDLVEAPPAILNYLCQHFHIEKVLIGTEKVNDYVEEMPNHIRCFFGGEIKYTVTISRYSKHTVRSQTKIINQHLLSGVNLDELNAIKKRYGNRVREAEILRNKRAEIEAQTDNLEFQRSELMKEQETFMNHMRRVKQLKEVLLRQKRKVANMQANLPDIPKLEALFKQNVKNYIKEIIHLQERKVHHLSEYQKSLEGKECAARRLKIHTLENEALSKQVTEVTNALSHAKEQSGIIEESLRKAAEKYRVKLMEAKCLTNGKKPTDRGFPFANEFRDLPDDMSQLREVISDTTARLECLGETNKNVIEEYENRCAEIEALSKKIQDFAKESKALAEQLETTYEGWFPKVSRIIAMLNENFGNFMKSMDYVGEVSLVMKDKFDFESYGIQIMVQYRSAAKLQALDKYVQSGGERAVAIAIYSLSMQRITHVPFRCVDEINQGMDSRNERKIFDMLVEETTKTGSSQYFFVTPKLLPNLNHNRRMSIHIVFNGKFVKRKTAFATML